MLFGAYPIIFQQLRGWSPGVGGLAFVGLLIGFLLAMVYVIVYENPRYNRNLTLTKNGWLPPEQRLPPAMIGGIWLPIVRFYGFCVIQSPIPPAPIGTSACEDSADWPVSS